MAADVLTKTASRDSRNSGFSKKRKLPRLTFALRGPRKDHSDASSLLEQNEPLVTSKLVELPTELLIAVFDHLDFQDLCSLISTNKLLREIITSPYSSISRHWSLFKLTHIPRLLNSTPNNGDYWTHLISLDRRWHTSEKLAEQVKGFIQYKTLLYHNAQRNLRFAPVARRIKERMTPLLFMISSYLSQTKALLLALDHNSSVSVADQVSAHTEAMLSSLPLHDLRTLHYTWLFLLWLLNTLLSRPTYAGTIERTFRGWTAEPLDGLTLATVLVLGNLPAIEKLLSLRDYVERRKWAHTFLRSLDPDENVRWATHWAELDVGLDAAPSKEDAKHLLSAQMGMTDLWTAGAERVFATFSDEDNLMEDERRPCANNTVRLLAELAGYDLFHDNVPQDYEDFTSAEDGAMLDRARSSADASM